MGALLGQQTHQITLETALASDNLVVGRFTITETMSASFVLHIDCLSPSARLDTAKLASQEVTLRLTQGNGKRRAWHGYVVNYASLGGDGGLARYRLRVVPWFDRLRTRSDCFVYQDKTALKIIEDVFSEYPTAHYKIATTQPCAERSIYYQYHEADYAFVMCLPAKEGLSFHTEHGQSDDKQQQGST